MTKLITLLALLGLSSSAFAFDDAFCTLSISGSLKNSRYKLVKKVVAKKGYQLVDSAEPADYVLEVKEFKDKLYGSTQTNNAYVSPKGKRVYVNLKDFRLNQVIYSRKQERVSSSALSFFPSYKKILTSLLKGLPRCK